MSRLLSLAFAGLIWIVCVGCAGTYRYTHFPINSNVSGTYPVYVDKRLSGDDVEIDAAIAAWNYALNGKMALTVVDWSFDMDPTEQQEAISRNGFLILRIDGDNPTIPDSAPGYWTLGFVPAIGNHWIYLVRQRVDYRRIKYLTMHEIGHALGARHRQSGLMSRYYNSGYKCVDYLTVEQVAAYMGWDVGGMNYCLPDGSERIGGPIID
jgi:hypothetical protein